MKIQLGRGFWIVVTSVIIVLTTVIVGRNAWHAVTIKRQINDLERKKAGYLAKIEQDSTLVEHLRYDEYLEEFARENFHMQRPGEQVYILDDK